MSLSELPYLIFTYALYFLITFLQRIQGFNNQLLLRSQQRGHQSRSTTTAGLPLWDRLLQNILLLSGLFLNRVIDFLRVHNDIERRKNPIVFRKKTNETKEPDLKRLHSEIRRVDKQNALHHVPEPHATPQVATTTDHYEHPEVSQLLTELKEQRPVLHHLSTDYNDAPRLRSNTDHFEHQLVNTDRLQEEIVNHPRLNHVEIPASSSAEQPILQTDTDHFEHVDIETTERLLDEIRSLDLKEDLNHVPEPLGDQPKLVADQEFASSSSATDIELLHAALDRRAV
jgi:hypothetical protein